MKRLLLSLCLLPVFAHAAEPTASLNFQAIPLVQFAQATYKVMLKRDYVLSPELLAMDRPITVSVRNIPALELPAFVEGVLASQGVLTVERKGIYYLTNSVGTEPRSGGQALPLSGPIRSAASLPLLPEEFGPTGSVLSVQSPREEPDVDHVVYVPLNRKADFIVASLNSIFASHPAALAGGVVVLSSPKAVLDKVLLIAQGIDLSPNKVKVSATFVEVSTSAASGAGVSVIANLLGAKLGVKFGSTGSGSLSLGNNNFQIVLDALASDSRFHQVSSPTALVDDYEKTSLSFGDSVPTVGSTTLDKSGNPLQQIVYQPSGVLLDVTTRVLGSGKINVSVDGQVSSFGVTATGVIGSPTLSKRQVQTSLTLSDSEILVIGGLNSAKNLDGTSGMSFLPKSWASYNNNASATDLVLILSAQVVK